MRRMPVRKKGGGNQNRQTKPSDHNAGMILVEKGARKAD